MTLISRRYVLIKELNAAQQILSKNMEYQAAINNVLNLLKESLEDNLLEFDEVALDGKLILPLPSQKIGLCIATYDVNISAWTVPNFPILFQLQGLGTTSMLLTIGYYEIVYQISNIVIPWIDLHNFFMWLLNLELPNWSNPVISNSPDLYFKVNGEWIKNDEFEEPKEYRLANMLVDIGIGSLVAVIIALLLRYGLGRCYESFQKKMTANANVLKSYTLYQSHIKADALQSDMTSVGNIAQDTKNLASTVKNTVDVIKTDVNSNGGGITGLIANLASAIESIDDILSRSENIDDIKDAADSIKTKCDELKSIIGLRLMLR